MGAIFKKSVLFGTVALAALSLVSGASLAADPVSTASGFQPYVSVFGGASFLKGLRGGHKNVSTSGTSPNTTFTTTQNGTFKTKTGYILGAAAGARWNDILRTEIEFSHLSNAFDSFAPDVGKPNAASSGSIEQNFLLGNVWFDLPLHSAFSPYVGGGIGVGWANGTLNVPGLINNASFTQSGPGFAWQVGGGVIFDINDRVAIDVGYRYKVMNVNFSSSDPNTFISDKSLASHNVQVGLTVKF